MMEMKPGLRPDPREDAFVQNMVRARTRLSWSQNELARRLRDGAGLSFHQQTVQRIEAGERPVRLSEALLIAKVLGMGDLEAAATPTSAKEAWSALETTVKLSASEQRKTKRQLWNLLIVIDEAGRTLAVDVNTYRQAAADPSMLDNKLVDRATEVSTSWEKLARLRDHLTS